MFSSLAGKTSLFRVTLVGVSGVGCCLLWKSTKQNRNSSGNVVLAKSSEHGHSQTRRKTRFDQFASIEVDGQYVMTPADFLESVMYRDLPGWSRKRPLPETVISQMVKSTPPISKGSTKFFRTLQENGIITFSEYLFLLTILTKSQRGMEIAFKMLDKDGNGQLCKKEFFVLEDMVNKKASAKSMALRESETDGADGCLNKTTLTMHFFGSRGTGTLTFQQFSKFMQDLQLEVFEMEFMEYSRGMPTIPEDSFACLLLRHTSLEEEEIQKYLDRLGSRLKQRKGITLKQFLSFGMFLNNLEDFALAMRIYSIAGQAVTQEEFQRAVHISTGQTLDPYVVHTVFELFDKDGDGKLSYGEFVELMKDRVQRGFGVSSSEKSRWQGFKQCVKKEMSL